MKSTSKNAFIAAFSFLLLPLSVSAATFDAVDLGSLGFAKGGGASYATEHNAATADSTEVANGTRVQNTLFAGGYYIRRIGYIFDTDMSGISVPMGQTLVIDSAVLHIWPTAVGDADNDCVVLVGFTPSNPSIGSWTTSDYNDFGTTKLSADLDLTTLNVGADNTLALNSSGLSALNTGAGQETVMGIRTCNDITATAPTGSNEYTQIVTHYSYITITYHFSGGSSSSSSFSTGSGSLDTNTGSLVGSHSYCTDFVDSGSGNSICTAWDTSYEIPMMKFIIESIEIAIWMGLSIMAFICFCVCLVLWLITYLIIFVRFRRKRRLRRRYL